MYDVKEVLLLAKIYYTMYCTLQFIAVVFALCISTGPLTIIASLPTAAANEHNC